MKIREIACGLHFPEGPVALGDGSILVVEIATGFLTRITQSGRCSAWFISAEVPMEPPWDQMVRSTCAITVEWSFPSHQMDTPFDLDPNLKITLAEDSSA